MVRRVLARRLPLVISATLFVLLAVLAVLQYRWIGQVSSLERGRMRARLFADGARFAADFDREVTRAFLYFHPDLSASPEERLERTARQLERWRAEAPYPRLVRDVFHVQRDEAGQLSLEALRPETGHFAASPWPADLEPLRRRLAGGSPKAPRPVDPRMPGLVIPLDSLRHGFGDGPRTGGEPLNHLDHLIIRFDRRAIAQELLPALTRDHFGSAQGVDYAVAVLAPEESGGLIFRSDPGMPAEAFRSGDVSLKLFGLRPFDELRGVWSEGRVVRPRRSGRLPGIRIFGPPDGERDGRGWRLVVKHREGSLAEAVARVRRRNLAVSLGILVLLAGTAALMVVATRRAERLARQQIEFVAGVSHELNTPLAAIRSAGENLADGVVKDPAQVRRYGALVASEGRRLSGMVAQVLEFAGIQSGRRVYNLQPVAVEEVVDGALADSRWLLEQKEFRVDREIASELPPVLGDAAALRRALHNLIENAVKYDGRERWIGIRAQAGEGGVEVTVADRGAGIHKEDLPHLFEPFYRGREKAAGSVPGSGLGLSIVRHVVEAHRGRVSVETGGPGRGSAFTIHLPAAQGAQAS
jgi:signal transduction histidine kinase